ncbi:uncharacterized protein LOC129726403 [Wyeomyia smithii]|uniref:uncharacterized protein LOC129726403 n=1 Tax=Wyeomyia smithii TaxID=174621 RepID=UPI002467BEC8|nr:uncharacterized protein LOC129726403 [Wyeomyia smithii]XP_055539021.1 uncharacterized protein LOC129726403 [Wyeomyia smithii]XP_055539026.1 uncharacterized protein LOC129726403 [Wyeomyia smithii]XP_055539034.1 uncharacterized protein LOC129726403 [Wyeomyia smithii]XP_055539043.1 uncharacterized protein LOC129726403 [Wyeomyia smithii]XP_055539051.1 uncharacterized protein LOC129726403 [Wyeomyia smithii]XP_055539061.1 uncharacterized protein LOC129726403 [Wyeomyia smithii]XP_055539070.1 unc
MDKIWITFLLLIVAIIHVRTNGQSVLNVQLVVKKYVERGSAVALYCENDAAPNILYKVTFLKGGSKIFEYIKGRNPPYRNFSIPGAEIDWKKVTPSTLTLKNVDYEASGSYYCEVSTDTPIYTKASNDEPLHVMLPQKGPPTIEFAKKQLYYGDMLVANCTTSRARPAPHITWLINGKQVADAHVRQIHHSSKNSHRTKQQQTLPSSGSAFQSVYHGKVIVDSPANTGASGSTIGGSGTGNSLKDLKLKAKAVDEELQVKAAKASLAGINGFNGYSQPSGKAANVGYNGEGGFQIQPNTGYNSFDAGYNFGMKTHHRERERSGGIGVFTMGGDRMGDEADEEEESDKKTSWLRGDYHTNVHYDNKQQQQRQEQHFDNLYRKHRNSFEHKYRRHVNDATGGGGLEQRKIHRVSASYSQLSIRITEALTNNLGRIEITCLATIPAHVEQGEQYADYKTSLIKLDIEQNDMTSPEPSTGSLAHAKSDAVQTSNFQTVSAGLCRNLLAIQCSLVALVYFYRRSSATTWYSLTSQS